jgi:hypothetical protein
VRMTGLARRRRWLSIGLSMLATVVVSAAFSAAVAVRFGGNRRSAVAPPIPSTAPKATTLPAPVDLIPANVQTSWTCPSNQPVGVPSSQRPGTESALVPGVPVALLACRFHANYQARPYGSLAATRVLSAAVVARGLNTLTLPRGSSFTCTYEPDQHFLLIFRYKDGTRLYVFIGCSATNGDLRFPMPLPSATPSWTSQLDKLGSDTLPQPPVEYPSWPSKP